MWKQVAILAACLTLATCGVSDQDKKSLQSGYADYSSHNLENAANTASAFIKKYPNEQSVDEAYYLRGISRLGRGDKAGGAEDLKIAVQKTKRPDLKEKALRALGDVAFENQQWDDAKSDYLGALASAPAKDQPYLHYRVGQCLQSLGQWDAGKAELWKALALNPDPALKDRILAHVNAKSFSVQFGAFPDSPHAGELKSQLTATGLMATVATELRGGKLFYLVRYGSYATWEAANSARLRFLAKYPTVIIAP